MYPSLCYYQILVHGIAFAMGMHDSSVQGRALQDELPGPFREEEAGPPLLLSLLRRRVKESVEEEPRHVAELQQWLAW